ncbi:MAG TPA: HEAT repeat domain-containing protein [Blastocatellia bacterium]|nr:HEAT repeat domain-containing protein [Blastocatellia bacterium]
MGIVADKIKGLVTLILGQTKAEKNSSDQLRLIEDAVQRSAIYEIGSFALSDDEQIRQTALIAINNALGVLSPVQLAKLDLLIREVSPYLGENRKRWFQLSAADLSTFESAELSFPFFGLASFHSSGYVRESAIKRLKENHDGRELPYLLIRLNDWVAPVQQAAEKEIFERIRIDYAHHWVSNLALLRRLILASRKNHQPFGEAVFALLRQPECQPALLAGLVDKDVQVRKLCFQLAAESNMWNLRELTERSLSDTHPGIRLWGARQVSKLDASSIALLLDVLRKDRFMPVRREYLRFVVDKLPDRAIDDLKFALFDSSASLRWEAAQLLQQAQPFDLLMFYRRAFDDMRDENLIGALSGLGENGKEEDAPLVLRYIDHPRNKVRKTALRSLSNLSAQEYLPIFLAKLLDQSTAVSNQAGKALADKSRFVQGSRLWEAFCETPRSNLKLRILLLIFRLPKWESIPFLLNAVADSDQMIAQASIKLINRWCIQFNRQFAAASAAQLDAAKQAFEGCKHRLPELWQKNLAFYLKEN